MKPNQNKIMTKQHYKSLSLTFLIIIIWTVYVFFDYFSEIDGFIKLTLFFDYYSAVVFSSGLAAINVILRFTRFRKKNTDAFKDNFFYVFSAIANLFLSIVWFIYLIITKQSTLEFLTTFDTSTLFIDSNIIFAILILIDIYYFRPNDDQLPTHAKSHD
jgi:membrane protease YdiL (CAAX protease family)